MRFRNLAVSPGFGPPPGFEASQINLSNAVREAEGHFDSIYMFYADVPAGSAWATWLRLMPEESVKWPWFSAELEIS